MDTSTPALPEDGSRTWRVDTVAGQVQAIDALLAIAERHVQLFDVDLAQGGWHTAARAESLTRFLRRAPRFKASAIAWARRSGSPKDSWEFRCSPCSLRGWS